MVCEKQTSKTFNVVNASCKNSKYLNIYLLITLFIFTFVAIPSKFAASGEILIPFITGKPVIIHFYFTIVFLIIFFVMQIKSLKFDVISSCLFLKCVMCIAQLPFIVDKSNFLVYFATFFISFATYFIASNVINFNYLKFVKIYITFGIIICFQVILTSTLINVSYLDLSYKYYMRIPLSASNVIASYLIPCLALFLMINKKNNVFKIISIFLFAISIILTKSRGGIIACVIVVIVWLLYFNAKNNLVKKAIISVLVLVAIIIILNIPSVVNVMEGYTTHGDDNHAILNSLSSGRIKILVDRIETLFSNPLFGHGYLDSGSSSHNFIIELLFQSGIIGTLIYIIPITLVIKKALKNNRNDIKIMSLLFVIIIILINGLYEVTFFNYSTDVIFWLMCGALVSICKSNKPKQ